MTPSIQKVLDSTSKRYKERFGYAGSSGTFQGIKDDEIIKFNLQSNQELLAAVRDLIEEDRVELRDASDHLPAAYQYLKGKNDLRDKLITALSEGKEKV